MCTTSRNTSINIFTASLKYTAGGLPTRRHHLTGFKIMNTVPASMHHFTFHSKGSPIEHIFYFDPDGFLPVCFGQRSGLDIQRNGILCD